MGGSTVAHMLNQYARDGLIGDYDYAFLFTPNIPFMKKARQSAPFFGLNDKMPVLLALLLGLQHSLAMLAGGMCPFLSTRSMHTQGHRN